MKDSNFAKDIYTLYTCVTIGIQTCPSDGNVVQSQRVVSDIGLSK